MKESSRLGWPAFTVMGLLGLAMVPMGLSMGDPKTGPFTLETIKNQYKKCRGNGDLLRAKNESRSLVYTEGQKWVALTLVTHNQSLRRGRDGSLKDLEDGRWIGHIRNYGTDGVPEYDIIGTADIREPAITCVWVGKGSQPNTLRAIFLGPDAKPVEFTFKREAQQHDEAIADFIDERVLMSDLRAARTEEEARTVKKKPIVVGGYQDLLKRLGGAWFVCDVNGCCKQ